MEWCQSLLGVMLEPVWSLLGGCESLYEPSGSCVGASKSGMGAFWEPIKASYM